MVESEFCPRNAAAARGRLVAEGIVAFEGLFCEFDASEPATDHVQSRNAGKVPVMGRGRQAPSETER